MTKIICISRDENNWYVEYRSLKNYEYIIKKFDSYKQCVEFINNGGME